MRTGLSNSAVRVARTGILSALAIVFSYLEFLLPPLVPIAGFKIGFANLVVMCAFCISAPCALIVSVLRVLVIGILFSNPVSFALSFAGALFSFIWLFAALKLKAGRFFSWIGVSVISAFCHNTGQLFAAFLIIKNSGVLFYTPLLLAMSVICGGVMGVIMIFITPGIEKIARK